MSSEDITVLQGVLDSLVTLHPQASRRMQRKIVKLFSIKSFKSKCEGVKLECDSHSKSAAKMVVGGEISRPTNLYSSLLLIILT